MGRGSGTCPRAAPSKILAPHTLHALHLHIKVFCETNLLQYSKTSPFSTPTPLSSIGMAAAPTTRASVDEYPHDHHRPLSPNTSLSPTLINNAHPAVRPSLKLSFPSDILNSVAVDTAGQSLYSVSSNSKRTTLVSCRDNVEIATVQWDRSSPRMVFRQKKIKCKEWLPLTGPENEY
jgi:hypothetical protein